MGQAKKIIVLIEKQDQNIVVSLSDESDLPEVIKLYLEVNSLTIFQKVKYNGDINNSLKEYLVKMSKCSLELEENNRIWMKKFEQQQVEFEQQQTKFEQLKDKFDALQKVLIDNGLKVDID